MPTFEYRGRRGDQIITGIIEASSKDEALALLRRQQIIADQITKKTREITLPFLRWLVFKIEKLKEWLVGSRSVALEIDQLMDWLVRKVRLENPGSIREYLLQFAELLDVIPKAVDAAKIYFPEAQMVMDVYRDPEVPDCYLVLYIRLKRYDDSVIERMEKAEAEFLNQLVNKRGWIQLTTDFREPEGEGAL